MIKITPLPAFQDNYIWVLESEEESGLVVVDPGDPVPVINWLQDTGKSLSAIWITHHHRDHTGGILTLVDRYQVPVYGPANSGIDGISHSVAEGDTLSYGGSVWQVLDVPGHTLDHIVYFTPAPSPVLFCGDTLFSVGCGRLSEGTPQQMAAALAKIASLPDNTAIYCTHEYTLANIRFAQAVEPDNLILEGHRLDCEKKRLEGEPTLPSNLGLEKQINPFLRSSQPAVKLSAQRWSNSELHSPVEVFAAVRRWKDGF